MSFFSACPNDTKLVGFLRREVNNNFLGAIKHHIFGYKKAFKMFENCVKDILYSILLSITEPM